LAVHIPTGHCQHNGFGVVHRCGKFNAVEHQSDLHGGMADSFVAIHKGLILDQRETQRFSFRD
jgi:hypothetical protein